MADLKKTITIPKTQARMKPYVALYGAIYDGTKQLSDAELLAIPLKEIGTVRKFSYTNDRDETKYYRVFGENENGQIKETYPGLADYKLVFETVILYKNSLFEQFGYSEADIMYFDSPVILQAVLKAPEGVQTQVWTFAGVWFENNKLEFEADADDNLIVREINAKASKIIP